jgi:solute carrier family 10 (sodium/bile acid cotransporter), member 7
VQIKTDGFLWALFAVIALATLWPAPGATGGVLHADFVSRYGIVIVFLLYGLTLAPEKLRAGLLRWPVHIVAQAGTFVVFPIVVLSAGLLIADRMPAGLWLGFLYIAALPSTVSSSVAMTSMAKGNVPVAIFNASLSSLLGVLLTPLLAAWFISRTGGSLSLAAVIGKVVLLVLAPMGVGLALQRWLHGWALRHIRVIRLVDRGVILAIVYNSFSDSIRAGVWSGQEPATLAEVVAGSILLFFAVFSIVKLQCHVLGFNREDTIACLFCASKKSLATGVPLAGVIFGASPMLGLIIAPLMVYHFCQLVIASVLAGNYARGA